MGGEGSGCDEATTDVLIESALWDPANIARTGRDLGIITDARYRFERGVDPDFCIPGAELATKLVIELCGGEPSRLIVAGDPVTPRKRVPFPYSEVKRLTGLDLPQAEGEAILRRLGFGLENGEAIVPNWRPDIDGKADIVEQIIRIAGLDRVASTPLPRLAPGVPAPVLTLLQKRTRIAKRALAALGLDEAITWSFIPHSHAELFGGGQAELQLANPIAADMSDMRPSLIPGLAAAAERNARRGLRDVALFEAGQVFLGAGDRDQRMCAAALRRGLAKRGGEGRHWSGGGGVDVFDAKGDALALLAALSVPEGAAQIIPGGPPFLHPGRCATLQFGPKNIVGWFGQLHPSACEALDVEGPLVAFEIVLDALPPPKARPTKAKPKLERSEFMAVERDLAFVTAEATRAADIVKAALTADRALLSRGSGVRRLSRSGRRRGPQVRGDQRHFAAARAHPDGRRDRRGRRQDRRRGRQADGSDPEGMRTILALIAILVAIPAAAENCAKFEEPLAYNACLARQGPAARAVHLGGAGGRRQGADRTPRGRIVSTGRRGRTEMVFQIRH